MIDKIKEILEKVKAEEARIYDLRGISPLFDYMFVVTIDVARQADAAIAYFRKEKELKIRAVEGKQGSWILIDLNDIIVHVFTRDARENYDLDRLYLGLPQLTF